MNPIRKKQQNSVLGLTLEGRRLESTILRKGREGLQLEPCSGKDLALNPLKDDPVLTGREIRQQLDEVGISERKCIVGLPLEWTLTHLVKLPKVDEEHIAGFIQLQAEKSFPFALDDLDVRFPLFHQEWRSLRPRHGDPQEAHRPPACFSTLGRADSAEPEPGDRGPEPNHSCNE